MLAAIAPDGARILARETSKAAGPFRCPGCGAEVIVKKGSLVVHHFAHLADSTCAYSESESEEHLACKMAIYDALVANPKVVRAEVEFPIEGCRPDVYF